MYFQEILHDILYLGRGNGGLRESEIFSLGYPLIIADDEMHGPSILNALQSHYMFESMKKIVEINGIRVIGDTHLPPLRGERLINDCFFYTTRQDMAIADKVKKGLIKIESRPIRYEDGSFSRQADVGLLRDLYGLDDGIVKNRFDEDKPWQAWGRGEYICGKELTILRAIAKAEASGLPLDYAD
jgi:hypothetical protein